MQRRWRLYHVSPLVYWAANLLLLGLSIVIVFLDERIHAVLRAEPAWTELFRAPGSGPLLFGACFLGIINLILLIAGLWIGTPTFRQLKSLAVLIALISFWLGFVLNCRNIAWQGRSWRLARYVAFFDRCAQPLETRWPARDGELPDIGPFMAYPVGRPRTLILLTPPQVFDGGPAVRAIERADSGALRFELSDREGDWIERHVAGRPESHVGGLYEQRQLARATPLVSGWYLVRYREASHGNPN